MAWVLGYRPEFFRALFFICVLLAFSLDGLLAHSGGVGVDTLVMIIAFLSQKKLLLSWLCHHHYCATRAPHVHPQLSTSPTPKQLITAHRRTNLFFPKFSCRKVVLHSLVLSRASKGKLKVGEYHRPYTSIKDIPASNIDLILLTICMPVPQKWNKQRTYSCQKILT